MNSKIWIIFIRLTHKGEQKYLALTSRSTGARAARATDFTTVHGSSQAECAKKVWHCSGQRITGDVQGFQTDQAAQGARNTSRQTSISKVHEGEGCQETNLTWDRDARERGTREDVRDGRAHRNVFLDECVCRNAREPTLRST